VRTRVWLSLSLILNLSLGAFLWHQVSRQPPPRPAPAATSEASSPIIRTNTIVRRQFFLWSDVESADYRTYIQNLRDISCPETTIRDIIVADINQLFANRRATNLITSQQQWWLTQPDPELEAAANLALAKLEKERRDLLTELLGPDWESADYPFPSAYSLSQLDGPILGALSPNTKAAIHEIERQEHARLRSYLAEANANGTAPETAALAQIQLEARADLSEILTPEQLEEYLLRYAPTAIQLRRTLQSTSLSPEEFQQLFHTIDTLEFQLATLDPNLADATTLAQSLQQQKADAIKSTLGDDRYESIRLAEDPLYQQAQNLIQTTGAPEETLLPFAAIVRLTRDEEQRILNDPTLSAESRIELLESTRQAERESIRTLLGQDAYDRYLEMQSDAWENPRP
jgi:hypothetical protein